MIKITGWQNLLQETTVSKHGNELKVVRFLNSFIIFRQIQFLIIWPTFQAYNTLNHPLVNDFTPTELNKAITSKKNPASGISVMTAQL